MTFRDFIVALIAFLCVLAMCEVILPEGNMRAYVRYAAGLLTVLFLLNYGGKLELSSVFDSSVIEEKSIIQNSEELVASRVMALVEGRVADDILASFPNCVHVNRITVNDEGKVTFAEIVAEGFISKEELSKKYGVMTSQIVIRGVGEREDSNDHNKKVE